LLRFCGDAFWVCDRPHGRLLLASLPSCTPIGDFRCLLSLQRSGLYTCQPGAVPSEAPARLQAAMQSLSKLAVGESPRSTLSPRSPPEGRARGTAAAATQQPPGAKASAAAAPKAAASNGGASHGGAFVHYTSRSKVGCTSSKHHLNRPVLFGLRTHQTWGGCTGAVLQVSAPRLPCTNGVVVSGADDGLGRRRKRVLRPLPVRARLEQEAAGVAVHTGGDSGALSPQFCARLGARQQQHAAAAAKKPFNVAAAPPAAAPAAATAAPATGVAAAAAAAAATQPAAVAAAARAAVVAAASPAAAAAAAGVPSTTAPAATTARCFLQSHAGVATLSGPLVECGPTVIVQILAMSASPATCRRPSLRQCFDPGCSDVHAMWHLQMDTGLPVATAQQQGRGHPDEPVNASFLDMMDEGARHVSSGV
jgi:hypothetical protein